MKRKGYKKAYDNKSYKDILNNNTSKNPIKKNKRGKAKNCNNKKRNIIAVVVLLVILTVLSGFDFDNGIMPYLSSISIVLVTVVLGQK
jgi:uncharacterized membrane protein YkgB